MRTANPAFEHRDERGVLREIARGGNWAEVNEYERKAGSVSGNHYHKETEELFYIISGSADVIMVNIGTNEKTEFTAKANDSFSVHPNEAHKLTFKEDTVFITLLSKEYDHDNPDTFKHEV